MLRVSSMLSEKSLELSLLRLMGILVVERLYLFVTLLENQSSSLVQVKRLRTLKPSIQTVCLAVSLAWGICSL